MLVVSEDLVSLWQVLSLTVHCGIGDVFNNKTGKVASTTLPPSGQKSARLLLMKNNSFTITTILTPKGH